MFLGATRTVTCLVVALYNFLSVYPTGKGPLFVKADGTPLLKATFVQLIKKALSRWWSFNAYMLYVRCLHVVCKHRSIFTCILTCIHTCTRITCRMPREVFISLTKQLASQPI